MANKQSSPELSSLAAQVLKGHEPTKAEINKLAASVISQDEERGQEPTEPTEQATPPIGADFLETLKAAIAPLTIAKMQGKPEHMLITLSDGKVLEVKRQRAKADPEGYVAELLA
jgi:hypothetical protein